MFAQLEDIYVQEAVKQQTEVQISKKVYGRLIDETRDKQKEKKQFEKMLRREEDEKMKQFWVQEERKRTTQQRARQFKITQARRFNKSMVQSASHYIQTPSKDNHIDSFLRERRLHFQDQKGYFALAQHYEECRQRQKSQEREQEIKIIKQKQQESLQMQQRRRLQYDRYKQKHFSSHNPEIFKQWEQINLSKIQEKQDFQKYYVEKGAMELQQRVKRNQQEQIQMEKILKERHLRQLKSQLDENNSKQAIDKYVERTYEKERMNERSKRLQMEDEQRLIEKRGKNKELLDSLKQQIKVQHIDDSPIEFAGIGSPVHIGKLMNDDRKKQMHRVHQDLYNSLNACK